MSVSDLFGTAVSLIASSLWHGFQFLNRVIPDRPFHPSWAPSPAIKQKERTFPQLGFPRETDSLCPQCVMETRDSILKGKADYRVLVNEHPGEIKAKIVERENCVYMEKSCP